MSPNQTQNNSKQREQTAATPAASTNSIVLAALIGAAALGSNNEVRADASNAAATNNTIFLALGSTNTLAAATFGTARPPLKSEELSSLDTGKAKALSLDQVRAIGPKDLELLKPEVVRAFSAEQLNANAPLLELANWYAASRTTTNGSYPTVRDPQGNPLQLAQVQFRPLLTDLLNFNKMTKELEGHVSAASEIVKQHGAKPAVRFYPSGVAQELQLHLTSIDKLAEEMRDDGKKLQGVQLQRRPDSTRIQVAETDLSGQVAKSLKDIHFVASEQKTRTVGIDVYDVGVHVVNGRLVIPRSAKDHRPQAVPLTPQQADDYRSFHALQREQLETKQALAVFYSNRGQHQNLADYSTEKSIQIRRTEEECVARRKEILAAKPAGAALTPEEVYDVAYKHVSPRDRLSGFLDTIERNNAELAKLTGKLAASGVPVERRASQRRDNLSVERLTP